MLKSCMSYLDSVPLKDFFMFSYPGTEFEIPANFRGSGGGERELCLKFCAGAGGSGGKIENFARERGEREQVQKFFAGAGGAGTKPEKLRGSGGCGRNSPALLLPRDPAGKKNGN